MKDYSIALSVTSVKAGVVKFGVRNMGGMPHQFDLIKTDLAPDKLPIDSAAAKAKEDGLVKQVLNIGPGKVATTSADLQPGHYVIICNVAGHYKLGMSVPGFTAGGFLIHFVRFSSFTGPPAPPAMPVFLLAMCVRSGPTLPCAVVPWTVWQPVHGSERNVSRPFFVAGSVPRLASATALFAQAAKSSGVCTTSVMSMSAWPVPQNSKHWPL